MGCLTPGQRALSLGPSRAGSGRCSEHAALPQQQSIAAACEKVSCDLPGGGRMRSRCPCAPDPVTLLHPDYIACGAAQVVAVRRDVALPDLAGGRLEHLALACRELRLAGAHAPLPPTLASLHLLLEARALKHLRCDP